MKKIYFLLFLTISSVLYAQDKLYVYQKDGNVRSFFCDEIDSITYSRMDVAGVVQSDFVTQKICLPDTIYTMQLSEIDSVSLRDPEVIFAKEVVFASDGFLSNIEGMHDSTLLLKETISSSLLPIEGQVLIDTISDRRFIGKVISLEKKNDRWEVGMTAPILTEIYEQLIFTEYFSLNESSLRAGDKKDKKFGDEGLPGFYGSFSMSNVIAGGNKIETCIRNQKLEGFYIVLAFDSHLQVGLKGELSRPYDFPIFEKLFPISAGGGFLSIKVWFGVFAGLSGSFDLYKAQDSRVAMGYEFKGGVRSGRIQVQQFPDNYSRLDFEGNAEVGLKLNLGIGTTFWKDTFGITSDVKFNLNGKVSLPYENQTVPGEFYRANKDSKLAFSFPWSIGVLIPERLEKELKKVFVNLDLSIMGGNFEEPFERYLLPAFTLQADPYKDDPTKAIIRMNVSRNLLFNQQVGIGLYEESGKYLTEIFAKDLYPGKDFPNPYSVSLSDLEHGTSYIIKPMTKLNLLKITCEPGIVYTIEEEKPDPEPQPSSLLIGKWMRYDTYEKDNDVFIFDEQGYFTNYIGNQFIDEGPYNYDETTETLILKWESGIETLKVKVTSDTLTIFLSDENLVYYRK